MFSRYDGILLRKTPYGDSDLVLSFLTQRGTETFFAKAAQRSRKRFSGQLDYFRRLSLVASQKREGEWLRLESCELLEVWEPLWQDPDKYVLASRWLERLRVLLPPGKGEGVYPFICDSLCYLASELFSGDMGLRFELRLSQKLGYGPNFEACRGCHRQDVSSVFFSADVGGVLCEACLRNRSVDKKRALALSAETFAWLAAYHAQKKSVHILTQEHGQEIRQLLDLHWHYVGVV